MIWLAYAALGLIAGILGGLLGVSGGIITIPCLIYLYQLQGFPENEVVQMAIGTSLAAMVFNALSSIKAHQNKQAIHWQLVKAMLPGLILGCLVGAFVGHLLPGIVLKKIFGCFAILLGAQFYFDKRLEASSPQELPSKQALNSLGFLVGSLSNILGIGGGTMTVPLFVKLSLPLTSAVGSSAVTGLVISFVGALSYLFFGLGEDSTSSVIGYIYLPAFIILSMTTFMAAPLGARLTHRLKTSYLKKIFAVFIFVIGMTMVF